MRQFIITFSFLTVFLPTLLFGQTVEYKSLDQALLNIDKCEVLNLYGQNLKVIPADITKLIKLKELEIGGNPNLDLKGAFTFLATIKSLEYLSIKNNKLKNIPSTISLLINLRQLNASGNKLKKLPDELCSLDNLEVLDIYDNHIKKLPDNLHHLKMLKNLNCNMNYIRQLPDSISKSNIRTLQLGTNRKINIEQVFSALFFCNSLDTLILYSCNIRTIPTIIYHQRNLKCLDLSGNPFETIPIELGQLTNLTRLTINEWTYTKYSEELKKLLPNTEIYR